MGVARVAERALRQLGKAQVRLEAGQQFPELHWFAQKVAGSGLETFLTHVRAVERGEQHHWNAAQFGSRVGAQVTAQGETVHLRHHHVEHEQVGGLGSGCLVQTGQQLEAPGHALNPVSGVGEPQLEHPQRGGVVVGQPHGVSRSGLERSCSGGGHRPSLERGRVRGGMGRWRSSRANSAAEVYGLAR